HGRRKIGSPAVRSHTVAFPSVSPPTPMVPVLLAANEVTSVVRKQGISMIGAALSASHICARLSVVEAMTWVMLGSAWMLDRFAGVGMVYGRRLEASCPTRVAWSFDAVMAFVPSPVTTTLVTRPAWPGVASGSHRARLSEVAQRVRIPTANKHLAK